MPPDFRFLDPLELPSLALLEVLRAAGVEPLNDGLLFDSEFCGQLEGDLVAAFDLGDFTGLFHRLVRNSNFAAVMVGNDDAAKIGTAA